MKSPAAAVLAWWCLMIGSVIGADYGTPEQYRKGQSLEFPDCTVVYQGERRVTFEGYPQGFVYTDFAVTAKDETKLVSWTQGTGVIVPKHFTVGGRDFVLELRGSVTRKGGFGGSELILWTRAGFEEALARRNQ